MRSAGAGADRILVDEEQSRAAGGESHFEPFDHHEPRAARFAAHFRRGTGFDEQCLTTKAGDANRGHANHAEE